MLIRNATAFLADRFQPHMDVRLRGGIILDLGTGLEPDPDEPVLDAEERRLLPGFVDIHTHAFGGLDVMRGEQEIRSMARAYHALGVSAFLPTTMSASPRDTAFALQAIRNVMLDPEPKGAHVAGAHMEAPFLNPGKCGAQKKDYLCLPNSETFLALCDHHPETVRLITLAPELEGADELISFLVSRNITVSVGHSMADTATVHHAAKLGLTHATHLFNAQPAFHHREPGVIGAALTEESIYCELICDGFHLHPDVVRVVLAAKGAKHTVAITDSMEAAGMPDGTYALGGQKVLVRDGRATLEDGTLAGSTLTMPAILRNLIAWGIPVETAVAVCTSTPADSVGLKDFGRLRIGNRGPLTLWDSHWKNMTVIHETGL